MLVFFFFHLKVVPRPKKKKPEVEEDGDATPSSRKRSRKGSSTTTPSTKKTKRLRAGDPGYDPYDYASSEDDEDTPISPRRAAGDGSGDQRGEPMDTGEDTSAPVSLDPER